MEGRIVIFITGNAKGTRVIVSVEQMCSCIQDFHTKFVDLPDLPGFARICQREVAGFAGEHVRICRRERANWQALVRFFMYAKRDGRPSLSVLKAAP